MSPLTERADDLRLRDISVTSPHLAEQIRRTDAPAVRLPSFGALVQAGAALALGAGLVVAAGVVVWWVVAIMLIGALLGR